MMGSFFSWLSVFKVYEEQGGEAGKKNFMHDVTDYCIRCVSLRFILPLLCIFFTYSLGEEVFLISRDNYQVINLSENVLLLSNLYIHVYLCVLDRVASVWGTLIASRVQ
ncbi:unnamed protein product [Phytomonas sp. Hart1]|nr:unnamed protein product [Phytomonas sp. Hart1]|eukprot:CCW68306.1 unnamed protein product [Phytomonas sp. isolate Hart1]